MSAWVCIQSREHSLWTVGFYEPDLSWHPHADYESKEQAELLVHFLNGGALAMPKNALPTPADPLAPLKAQVDTLEGGQK